MVQYGKKHLPSFSGIDCSGKSRVQPPTFEGVKALVNRVGEQQALAMGAASMDNTEDSPSQGVVRDFLYDYQMADKVERQTLVREFESYVAELKASKDQQPPGAEPAPGEPTDKPPGAEGGEQ